MPRSMPRLRLIGNNLRDNNCARGRDPSLVECNHSAFCRASRSSPVSTSSPTSCWKPRSWAPCRSSSLCGSSTPDVFMFLTYGHGISAGWLEPLNAYFSDRSLTDPGWYDESDLLKTARAFPVWPNGERYAFPITSEAVTLFINSDVLAAKNLPAPRLSKSCFTLPRPSKPTRCRGSPCGPRRAAIRRLRP